MMPLLSRTVPLVISEPTCPMSRTSAVERDAGVTEMPLILTLEAKPRPYAVAGLKEL